MRLAEETEKVAGLKYRTGKGSNLDVLDAETVLTNARISFVQVLTDYAAAVAELNYNLGNTERPFEEKGRVETMRTSRIVTESVLVLLIIAVLAGCRTMMRNRRKRHHRSLSLCRSWK